MSSSSLSAHLAHPSQPQAPPTPTPKPTMPPPPTTPTAPLRLLPLLLLTTTYGLAWAILLQVVVGDKTTLTIAVRSDGLTFVSDYLSDDIKVFDGIRLVATLGGHGSAPGRFRRITGLWVDEDSLYVADSLNRRVQILSLPSWELSRSAR